MAKKDETPRPAKPLKHGEKRIRKSNAKSFDIGKETPYVRKPKKPLTEHQKKVYNYNRSTLSKRPMDQTVPKEHNSLRFIGVVLRHFSVKYGLKKDDITLCLNLYNSAHFTVEEFNRASILNTGGFTAVFRRFRDLGYIIRVTHTIVNHRKNAKNKIVKTDRYRLSQQIVERMKFIYKVMDEIDVLNEEKFDPYLAHPRIINLVNKLDREVKDVLSGKKKPDLVIPGKQIEEEN